MGRNRYTQSPVRKPMWHAGRRDILAVESLGSTGGNIAAHGCTVITATAANLVYTLPAPTLGQSKWVVVDYTGNADDLIVACNTTAQFFNLSTANTIVVSSSVEHVAIELYGMSTSRWWCNFSGHRAGLSTDIVFTGSTVKSTTDVT